MDEERRSVSSEIKKPVKGGAHLAKKPSAPSKTVTRETGYDTPVDKYEPNTAKPSSKAPMKKEKKASRKPSAFSIGMIVYSLLFIVLAVVGLFYLWKYLAAYEASRPENFMDSFMDSMNKEKWHDLLIDNLAIEVSEFENEEEVFDEYFDSTVQSDNFTYIKKAGRYNDTSPVYAIKSNGNEIAVLGLIPDGSGKAGFGLELWKLDFVEPTVNGGTLSRSKVEIIAPYDCSVTFDGRILDSSFITDEHVDYVDLSDIERRMTDYPYLVKYSVDGIYLNTNVSVEGFGEIEPYLVEDGCYYYKALKAAENSFSVRAFSDMTVTVNGAQLSEDDASVEEWELFADLTEFIPDAPKICTYTFKGLYSEPVITVTDRNGNVLYGVDENGITVYSYLYDSDLEAAQKEFIEGFLTRYVNFATGDYNNRYGTHSALTAYVLDGTVLKQYFLKSVSGGGDGGNMLGVEIHELSASEFINISDNCYICTGTLDATEKRYDQDNNYAAKYEIVAIKVEDDWYVAKMPTKD